MRPIPHYLAVAGLCLAFGAQSLAYAEQAAPAKATKTAKPKKEIALPKVELTSQLLYEFLVAEIAGQRGDLAVASEAYLDLAKTTRDPRIAERATEVAMYAHQAAAARAAANIWLDTQPDSLNAQKSLAALLVNDGKLNEARPHLEKLIAAEGDNAGAGFMHLDALLARQKDKQAALELVKKLAAPYPNLAEAHFAIAQAAANANRYDEAMNEIKTTAKLKPGWELAALFQFQLAGRENATDGTAFLRDFLKQYPDAKQVRLIYARQLVSQNQYAAARDEFRQLAKEVPGNPELGMAIGLLSLQLNDLDGAESAFKAVLATSPADAGAAQIYLGQVAELRKQYDQAAKWYLSVAPGAHYISAQIRYAGLLAKQGKMAEARTYLHNLKVDGEADKIQLIEAEAQLLRETKDYKGVYELLSHALASRPDSPELLYDHAMAAERVNKLDVLEKDLRHLIQIKPDYAQAYNALGYTLADRTNRLTEAVQLLDHALKLAPNDAFILDSMGWAQYRQGNLDKSLDYLQRAFALRKDPEIAAHLGEVLWAKGNRDEARKLWQTALDGSPQNQALLDVMQKFKKP
ncbi:TPR domain protein [Sulfuriferula multivorans]|uniref:TPR domain protein n=1 Tax=Sulfuriferula multivorans TaxID=1559896 RepID=A0A401JHC7_9PROT|nr:tetratricopeptide repeat protein [Sulfuriferula multivorans]GBL47385.1 TPR domain protein [Sulfuriferula multivorans]